MHLFRIEKLRPHPRHKYIRFGSSKRDPQVLIADCWTMPARKRRLFFYYAYNARKEAVLRGEKRTPIQQVEQGLKRQRLEIRDLPTDNYGDHICFAWNGHFVYDPTSITARKIEQNKHRRRKRKIKKSRAW